MSSSLVGRQGGTRDAAARVPYPAFRKFCRIFVQSLASEWVRPTGSLSAPSGGGEDAPTRRAREGTMVFLGKIALESGGTRLAVTPEGEVALLALSPTDPAGIFLAYDLGGGWYSLQCHLGSWLRFDALQSPIAWYPV